MSRLRTADRYSDHPAGQSKNVNGARPASINGSEPYLKISLLRPGRPRMCAALETILALIGTADKPPSALASFIAFAAQATAWLPYGVVIWGGAFKPASLQ